MGLGYQQTLKGQISSVAWGLPAGEGAIAKYNGKTPAWSADAAGEQGPGLEKTEQKLETQTCTEESAGDRGSDSDT